MQRTHTLALAIATLVAAGTPSWAELSIQLAPQGEGIVKCTVSNPSHRTVRFLRHETPLANEFESSLFDLTWNGQAVPYVGKMVFRAGISAQDWMELQPGESISALINLADSYALNDMGAYRVAFKKGIGVRYVDGHRELKGDGSLEASTALALEEDQMSRKPPSEVEEVESNAVDFFVNTPVAPRREPAPALQAEAAGSLRHTFSGCSSSRITTLQGDFPVGQRAASNAYSKMYNKPAAQRPSWSSYRDWFGTYSANNYSYVMNGFSKMNNAFGRSWTVRCDVGCQPNWAAYVYPNQTYIVQICAGYFGMSGSDRGTVLLHEASHWTAIQGTQDHAYHYNNCKSLAQSSPSRAIANADSYRLFSLYVQ